MKKLSIFFLIFALTSQAAYAVIPLLVAGARIVAAGLKTSAGQDIVIGSAIGVGLVIAQLNWTRNGTDGSAKTDTLYYTNAPRPPSSIESAAGFTAGSPSLNPASTATVTVTYTYSGYSSPQAYCNANYGSGLYTAVQRTSDWGCQNNSSGAVIQGSNNAVASGSSCPSGYTLSSGTCNLTNGSFVARPSDGFCPIIRTGSTYAVDPTDPDCSGTGQSPTFASDGTFSVSSADGTSISSAPTGVAGKRKITYSYPDASKNTTNTRDILIADGATAADPAVVEGVIDKAVLGTGAATTTTPVSPTASTNPTDLSPVVGAVNSNTAAVNTAAAAQAAWNAAEPARIAADRAADRVVPGIEEIPKLNIPFVNTPVSFSSSASCPSPIEFSMMGKAYAIAYDPMCTLMTTLRPLFLALGAFGAAIIFIGGLKT